MDENKFNHDQTDYERPNFPFRCGRAALWQTPCHKGPNLDGTCGGTQECDPFLKNDRWECRRENRFGGPCAEGPGSRGECSIQRPPCAPRKALRVIRGRLALLAIGCVLALVGFSQGLNPNAASFASLLDPGPLSKSHKKFTEKEGCSACHAAYGKGPVGWIKAVFTKTDISDRCLNCHMFGGPGSKAHNNNLHTDREIQNTECIMCHREHSGQSMLTRVLTSQQCNYCHKEKFESFSKGHPEFSEKYPSFSRNTIKFDHSSHLNKHFDNPKFSEKAPQSCINCHIVTLADREVRPGTFEAICADCHDSQINKKELVLLRLPEFSQNLIDPSSLARACNFPEKGQSDEEEFQSVSTDQAALVSAFLLNVPENDPEAYNQPLQNLILSMAKEGTTPLARLIDGHTPKPIAKKLLAGLNPEVLKQAACSWGLNLEYEPPTAEKYGGWYADMLEVRYKPSGHRDLVAKSWVEYALAVSTAQDDEEKFARAIAMRDQLLSAKEGIGGCIKCHAVTAVRSSKGNHPLQVEWGYGKVSNRPYVHYSHSIHIEILGRKSSCPNCHVLDSQADYMSSFKTFDSSKWVSNFASIKRQMCGQCHAEKEINQDCQLCHVYHFKPSFKKEMVFVKNPIYKIPQ